MQRHILTAVEDQANALLAYTFEHYKSLDEDAPLGVIEAHMLTPNYQPTSAGSAAPALAPAVQLYALLHDILAVKVQDTLRAHLGEEPPSVGAGEGLAAVLPALPSGVEEVWVLRDGHVAGVVTTSAMRLALGV